MDIINPSPKYNRTAHLPWSKGCSNDDKIAIDISGVIGVPIVITCKMDGSNVSLERNGCCARTHASQPEHPSFDQFKALHASVKHNIPENIQLFCEWLYAFHSIYYVDLPSYCMMFNVRNLDTKIWESWDMVEEWAHEIKVPTVPVLFKGIVKSEKELKLLTEALCAEPDGYGEREGIVVRIASEFKDDDFHTSCMKMVRANHVQTTDHWKHKEIIKNQLKYPSK